MTSSLTSSPDLRPLALVTGASSGIGAAFAVHLAKEGYDLLLVARTLDRMKREVQPLCVERGATVSLLALDLTEVGATQELEQAVRRLRPLSLLVNNAGFGALGAFAEQSRADTLGMLDLNARAPLDLMHRFWNDLEETGGGIINVASLSAFAPLPWFSVYSASKVFLVRLSRLLASESKGSGIRIMALCPGYTRSAFLDRAGLGEVEVPRLVPAQEPAAVVEEAWRGFQKGKTVLVTGRINRVTIFLAPMLGPLFRLIGRLTNEKAEEARQNPGSGPGA